MLEAILNLFRRKPENPVQIRHRLYRERLDLTGKPLLLLSGASIATARELIPFLAEQSDMIVATVDRDEAIANNGDVADAIHVFANVRQGAEKLSRILTKDGRIIELTIKG